MIEVTKEKKGESLVVRLSGTIEENTNFPNLIGEPGNDLEISCKDVTRINSVGVKHWITYFKDLAAKGTRVRFIEVSVPMVAQFNMISNFKGGGEVSSVYAPYVCSSCGAEFRALFQSAELSKLNFEPPQAACPKCNGSAQFDDLPEEYFAFLKS